MSPMPTDKEDQTRLPPGWVWARLDQIAELKGGITKGQKRRPGEKLRSIPYLRVANVQRGYLDLSEMKEIEASEEEIEQLRLRQGDLLFNEGGDRDKLGRGWIWQSELPECIHQNHVFRGRLRLPEIQPQFVSWYSNSLGQRYFLEQGKQTTNLASINLTKLGALPIPLPPAKEQQRIVAEIEKQFSDLDAGIAALERVQHNLKRYRASVLKAACEGRLVQTEAELAQTEGRDYEPADKLLERILKERQALWEKEQLSKPNAAGRTPGNSGWKSKYPEPERPFTQQSIKLPHGWAWATVEQLTTLVQYGTSAKNDEDSAGIPILRMGNIVDGKLEISALKYLPQTHDEFPNLLLQPRDLLFNRTNSPELVGKTAVYNGYPRPCSFASYLIRVRLVDGYEPELLTAFINSPAGREWVRSVATQQVGQANVNGTKLQSLVVPIPPSAEQQRIISELRRCDSLIDATRSLVSKNLARAAQLRQAILRKAFEGSLVPQDPREEPASVLLERLYQQQSSPVLVQATPGQLSLDLGKPRKHRTPRHRSTST